MSSEAIQDTELIREFTRELNNKNAAIFAGAGLSVASGYVDWKTLLKDIIEDLRLDPDVEEDLVTIAQYYCNQAGGNKNGLTQKIFDHFRQTKEPTDNHRILAQLPIHTYWTTNYDRLIEKALENAKKVVDVKYDKDQLAVTRLDRDVIVYKMHGDIENPSKAIISKDQYESYPIEMSPFVTSLRGDLVEKTFLFLGFSFSDPNIDYILSRVRVIHDSNQRQHYCILKKVGKRNKESDVLFEQRKLKQSYFICDLKRFGIKTVLVNEYEDITKLLERISAAYKGSSIFVSGAAHEYGSKSKNEAENFVHNLSHRIMSGGNRIVSGFGLGVGSAVINGAISYLSTTNKTISDDDIVIRPFPQVATGGTNLQDRWTEYRRMMIDYAGIGIFVYGNKVDQDKKIIPSNGMKEEFDLCIAAGVRPLPIGVTGYMAKTLWEEVRDNFDTYYPAADQSFKDLFDKLGDTSLSFHQIIDVTIGLIDCLKNRVALWQKEYTSRFTIRM